MNGYSKITSTSTTSNKVVLAVQTSVTGRAINYVELQQQKTSKKCILETTSAANFRKLRIRPVVNPSHTTAVVQKQMKLIKIIKTPNFSLKVTKNSDFKKSKRVVSPSSSSVVSLDFYAHLATENRVKIR